MNIGCMIFLVFIIIAFGTLIIALLTLMMLVITDGWQLAYIYPKWAINEIYDCDLKPKHKYRFKIKRRELYYQIIVYWGPLSALLNVHFKDIDSCERFISEHLTQRRKYLEKLNKFNNIEDSIKLQKLNKILNDVL